MKSVVLKVIQFLFFLSVGAFLLYWAFKGIDLRDMSQRFRSVDYFWVWLSLVCGFLSHLCRGIRWKMLIRTLGYAPSVKNTFGAVLIGYLANYAFPRIGEVARCMSLNRTDRIPVDRLLGTVILERVVDMLVFALLLVSLLLFRFEFFGNFLTREIFVPLYDKLTSVISLPLLLAMFVLLLGSLWLAWYLLRSWLRELKVMNQLKGLVRNVWSGLTSILRMKDIFMFILVTLLVWGMYLLQTYLVFLALSFTSHLGLLDAVFILVMATFGFIIPVQGGIGTFHWAVALGLTLYAIPWEDGLVFATLSHTSGSLLTIALGFVAFVVLWVGKRKDSAVPRPK